MSKKPWTKYRRGNSYRVRFPTLPSLTVSPSSVELRQERFSHDILELIFDRDASLWEKLLKTGTPVTFTWFQGGKNKTWTGYVTHVSSQTAAQLTRTMKIVCIGASYVLKRRAARVWKNKSVTAVAAIIAKEFKLKSEIEPSSRTFEQLSMTGQSYWEWLQEHAKKIGYALYVENSTLCMKSLSKLLNESTSDAPTMALELPYFGTNKRAFDHTLDSFIVQKGDYFDYSEVLYSTKVTTGVNPITSKKVTNSTSPGASRLKGTRVSTPQPFFTDFSDEVVHSSSFSKKASQDQALGARFVVPAKAVGQGDLRVYPYAAVYILGTGAETDGYWSVSQVRHSFSISGLYAMDLDLVTDGVGPNSASPFRRANYNTRGTIDLDSIVLDASKRTNTRESQTSITFKVPAIKETDQGFSSRAAYWEAK